MKDLLKRFLKWWEYKRLERALNKELRYYDVMDRWFSHRQTQVESEQDYNYTEALRIIKRSINKAVKNKSKEEYHKVLSQLDELIGLGREETPHQKAMRKILENIYVAKGADIKTSKDKKKMIDNRISHYKELQTYKEGRTLLKQARVARKEGRTEDSKDLEEQWRKKYGPKGPRNIR